MNLLRAELEVEAFCPILRYKAARASGAAWVQSAMFPRYVFARFLYTEDFRKVMCVTGVKGAVRFGTYPSIVDDRIIHELREHVREQDVIVIDTSVRCGDEVDVVSGPFRGIRALVTRVIPARRRVAILLEVLGGEREVEISTNDVLADIGHPMNRFNSPD